jgi:hypothetical protein
MPWQSDKPELMITTAIVIRERIFLPKWYRMSDFERLLVPGCAELPACRCGTEMHIARTHSLAGKSDAHIRVYNCPACYHEMRLTVWGANPMT